MLEFPDKEWTFFLFSLQFQDDVTSRCWASDPPTTMIAILEFCWHQDQTIGPDSKSKHVVAVDGQD
jgi:hypothetical protein